MLEGIQLSCLIATFVILVAFGLAFFLKRVDVSREAVEKLEREEKTDQLKTDARSKNKPAKS